jgi:CheY-like chemotaxis protein
MVTARSDEADKVAGLEAWVDDYVTKPFSPRELVARVGAVLRRVRPALAGEQLAYADLEMDVAAHRVRRGGSQVSLGPTEFRLLRHFLEHPGRVFSRERLIDAVWSRDSDIDAAFGSILRQLISYMMEDPRTITPALEIVFIAKSIERIGDHAKNIAEAVVQVVKGKDVRHASADEIRAELAQP